MKILVACEESQAVTIAFRKKGHEAYSCDILPCSGGHPEWHIQDDVLKVIHRGGYNICIGFPPCRYLTNCGNDYFNIEKFGNKAIKRRLEQFKAASFFMKIWGAKIDKICIENPVGFMNHFLPPSQVIHPYYFGDSDKKRTCLWLKNLPKLVHIKQPDLFSKSTHVPVEPTYIDRSGKPRYFVDGTHSGGQSYERSKTFPAIAQAMADQWG